MMLAMWQLLVPQRLLNLIQFSLKKYESYDITEVILPVDSGVSSSTIISGDDAGDGMSRSFVTTLFRARFVSRTGKFILIGFFVSDGCFGGSPDVSRVSTDGRFVGRGRLRTELSVSEGFPGTIDGEPLILGWEDELDPDWLIPGIGFDELVMVNIGTVAGVIT